MKILIIGEFIEPPFADGEVNTVLNWSKAVNYAGADVKVLSISSNYSGHHKISGINFEYVKTKRPRFRGSLPRALLDSFSLQRETLRELDYEVVHFAQNMDGLSSIPMLTMLKLHKNKMINSYPVNQLIESTHVLRNLLFDMITVPSNRMYQIFAEKKIIPAKMRFLTPCVNTEEFRPRDKAKVREELGLESDPFLIFTIGHFKRGRLLIPLIQTIHELRREGKNIQLLIGWTGHGELEHIREIFSIAKNDEAVKIIPPTNQISLYYNASDIYVLTAGPNYVIETPLSLIEALSSGTPTIAFDVNASSEIIEDGVNGYIIEKENFAEMKSRLKYLMSNLNILEEFSKTARLRALNKYSFPKVGSQLFSLYREVVDLK